MKLITMDLLRTAEKLGLDYEAIKEVQKNHLLNILKKQLYVSKGDFLYAYDEKIERFIVISTKCTIHNFTNMSENQGFNTCIEGYKVRFININGYNETTTILRKFEYDIVFPA
jgi:hypothetical protein